MESGVFILVVVMGTTSDGSVFRNGISQTQTQSFLNGDFHVHLCGQVSDYCVHEVVEWSGVEWGAGEWW